MQAGVFLFNLVRSHMEGIMTKLDAIILADFEAQLDDALELHTTAEETGEVTVSDVYNMDVSNVETVEERFESEVMGIHDFDF